MDSANQDHDENRNRTGSQEIVIDASSPQEQIDPQLPADHNRYAPHPSPQNGQEPPQPSDNNHIQLQLPVLRESALPKVFPLSEVFVSFPTAKANFIKNTMFYKIDFHWNGEERSVNRRFSEIQNLREAFQSLLPFSFIFPVHRKQLIVLLSE